MKHRINMAINGRSMQVDAGSTILEAARRHDIHIPTLCHSEILRPMESCRLCVVKVEGEPHLQASCSTVVREGMVVSTDSDQIHQMRKLLLDLLFEEHYGDCTAPCHLTCPAGIDIQGYIALIAQGHYAEALRLIRERIPMPLTIGRVCPHFCEYKCNRNLVEEPININHLKRFVADYEMKSGERHRPALQKLTGRRVAIIGGGPAGLSAAYYLRCLGHASTIFDAMPRLGGMLRYGIPEYRLPKKVLDWEIDGILELGDIEVRLGAKWGTDFALEGLKKEGYDAFFVATGAWSTRKLGIAGEDLNGVHSGVDFLVDLALGKQVAIGKNVAIIGGGNVAIDAARNSVRMGVDQVTILYRRSRGEMPAGPEEVRGAEEEGVQFHFLAAPVRLLGSNGQVDRLEYIRMELGEPDASGRRRPIPVEGSETVIPVDSVITAIGQFPDLSALELDKYLGGVSVTRYRTIDADADTLQTGMEGVFTGGDVYRGPESVVRALADGRKAAVVIDRYLSGKGVEREPSPFNILKGDLKTIDPVQFKSRPSEPRVRMPELPPQERISGQEQIELGLSEDEARREAERCLSCGCLDAFGCRLRQSASEYGLETLVRLNPRIPFVRAGEQDTNQFIALDPNKCIRCKQCYEACTYSQCSDAIDFDKIPGFNANCVFCGLCVDVCPTGALEQRISGKPGPFHFRRVETFCTHCGCACNLVLNMKEGRIFTIDGGINTPPSYGHTCRKGRFDSFDYLWGDERLLTPLVRKDGKLVEAGWEEALDLVAGEFNRLKMEHGSESLAAIGSGRATNEADYLLRKIFCSRLGSNHLDYPGGEAVRASVETLKKTLGLGAMTNAFSDIEEADVIFCLGNLVEECTPIITAAMRRASRTHGRKLIAVSSVETGLGNFADPALLVRREDQLAFLQVILHLLIRQGLVDQEFVAGHTTGLSELEAALARVNLEELTQQVGIPGEVLETVARTLGEAGSLAIVYSEDLAGGADGRKNVAAVTGLALLTGRIGRQHSGIFPLYGRINAQGAADIGIGPGHQGDLRKSTELKGDRLTAGRGSTCEEIIRGVQQGTIKGLFVMENGPGGGEFGREQFDPGMSRPEFLVVQGTCLTESARQADVVLPSAAFWEQGGTVTTMERRIRRLNPVLEAPGKAWADWQILAELLGRLDPESRYGGAEDIYREIVSTVPSYQGMTHERLGKDGLQWPVEASTGAEPSGLLPLDLLKKPLEFTVWE